VLGIMALPFLVLAIACVNGGNLVLARATRMTGVWSLQLALGASRRRLLRQPIVEGILLALSAAALGLVLTRLGFVALNALIPFEAVIDLTVVAFAFTVALATPLLFGVGPVWSVLSRTRQTAPGQALRVSPRSRARTILLVVQAAMCVALLGTGTQFVRTIRNGLDDGLGRGDRMLVGALDVDKLAFTREQADDYYRQLLDRVRAVPGAGRAGLIGGTNLFAGLPLEGQTSLWLGEDAPDKPRTSVIAYATPHVLNNIGAPLLRGRMFTPDEHAGRLRSVIVNEPFARRHITGSPIGQTIRLAPRAANFPPNSSPLDRYARGVDAVIVGVVRGASGARNDANATVISPVPLIHLPARSLYIPFDDAGTLAAAAPAIREAIRSVDPRVPYRLARLDDARWGRTESRRFMAVAVAALGGLALLLAAIGLYGAVAYVVELRTREIGVRMAIGATSLSVLRTITGQGMFIAATGCGIGIAGAVAVSIVMRSQLYGPSTIDPLAFGGSVGLMLMTMLLASIIPARRAARIDPAIALRAD
jgi:predicted permease